MLDNIELELWRMIEERWEQGYGTIIDWNRTNKAPAGFYFDRRRTEALAPRGGGPGFPREWFRWTSDFIFFLG